MVETSSESHLAASELLGLVDGEGSPAERESWALHTRGCSECRAREEQLRGRTQRLSALLDGVQPPADFRYPVLPLRAGSRSRPWLKAAAAVLLLASAALAVTPLRATLVDWLSSRWGGVTAVAPVDESRTDSPAGRAIESGSTLGFTPADASFSIEFTSRQAAGALRLHRAVGPEGTLEMRHAGTEEMPLVSENSLRIRNSPRSVATYQVGVPESVTRVRVEVEGEPPVLVDTGPSWQGTVIDLQVQNVE